MLILIESKKEKVEAHRKLLARLERAWGNREPRILAWRPDSMRKMIHHNGKYWFSSSPPTQSNAIPRYWDAFGEYRKNGVLRIAVEINVPTTTNGRKAKGFLARDTGTGAVCLMHDGGVGGGQEGVGRTEFLRWSGAELLPVINSRGDSRLGIVVTPVDSERTADDISRFVQKVLDFREAVRNGETDSGFGVSAPRAAHVQRLLR